MKLVSIKLCNFRQFYGKTPEIKIAYGKHNTTIIHGNNGSGKTTLLNAFTWVLYEKFTAAFASPEQLVNKRAINEAKPSQAIEYWVEITFEHNHQRYQLKRLCRAYKEATIKQGKSQLLMQVVGDDGRWRLPRQHPEDVIGRILPESLHRYFFFDGERIEHIVRYDKKKEIAEATKELLGVKVLERAIEHLKKAKRTLEEELRDIGNLETKQLLQEQKRLEIESDRLNKRQQEIQQDLLEQEKSKKAIAQHLLELSGASELQLLKEQLETQEKSLRQNLVQARKNLKIAISTRGYTTFLTDINSQFLSVINNLRQKGELPTGIKQQFIQQLLIQKKCICGRELNEDTLPYQQVQSWIDKAGIADVEETVIRLEAQVEENENQIEEFWQEIDQEQTNINQWRIELSQIENELDKIKNKLRNYPNEDVQQLQQILDNTEERIRDLTLEQGANQQQIELIIADIEAKNKEIGKQKMKEEKQLLAQKRIQATQESIERLIEVRTRLELQFRLQLEQRVRKIFSAISFTPYLPKLSEKYELSLIENTTGKEIHVAASTGENQILSLSFIGGIIDRVREWSQKNTLMVPDSSTLPIVMDSPFGTLDEIYRRQVAKSLPKLANQLVILATKTQWRGEVEQEIGSYLGKEYVLVYNSPKSDCEEDYIKLKGINYPLVKSSSNGFEYTEIIEVQK